MVGRGYIRNASKKRPRRQFTVEELRNDVRYDPETGTLWRQIGSEVRSGNSRHLVVTIFGLSYSLHILVWFYMTGEWPTPPLQIDHINGNGQDNRWANLRLATPQQNAFNRKRVDSKSGVKGVFWYERNQKWGAYVSVGRKKTFIGLFDTIEEARDARNKTAAILHGEFARNS